VQVVGGSNPLAPTNNSKTCGGLAVSVRNSHSDSVRNSGEISSICDGFVSAFEYYAGRFGTFVLAFGIFGFLLKQVIQWWLGIE
jgi:hypothetical protein